MAEGPRYLVLQNNEAERERTMFEVPESTMDRANTNSLPVQSRYFEFPAVFVLHFKEVGMGKDIR